MPVTEPGTGPVEVRSPAGDRASSGRGVPGPATPMALRVVPTATAAQGDPSLASAGTGAGPGGDVVEDGFPAFVEQNLTEFWRLAHLITGDADDADDLTADAMLTAWLRWPRVCRSRSSVAHVRRIVITLAERRVRRTRRERARLTLLLPEALTATTPGPDTPGIVDLRRELRRLPRGQRNCLLLRHGLGLSEAETAATLGISVGTVKSQTSKASARLRRRLAVPVVDGDTTSRRGC